MVRFYNNNIHRGTIYRHQDNTKQTQGDKGVTLQFIQTELDLFLFLNHVSIIVRVLCASALN